MPTADDRVAAVRARDVRKRYGPVVALDGVDLTVEPGTLHCLAGPNGSGKTTLMRIVLGLTDATGGSVAVGGTVGCSFQTASVFEALTVAENLAAFGRMTAIDPDWRETVVERLALDDVRGRVAAELSEGYRKKLDLALGLVKRPDVVLLDEPLADLDDASRVRVVELLADYEGAVLVSSHNLEAFAPLCDRLTVVYEGEVVLDADRPELAGDPAERYREIVRERVRAE